MKVLLSFLLFVGAGSLVAYEYFNLSYWRMEPAARVDLKWNREIEKLEAKSAKLKTALLLLKEWKMTTTDQQFKDMIDQSHPPFRQATQGRYTLEIQIMPWIEDMKYGYLIQHELFDSNKNKVDEFNINIDIGYLW